MPKRRKNPAKPSADFTKRKNKVGKKAAPSSSETRAKLDGAQGDARTNPSLKQGARLVPLTDILSRCGHTSAKFRADAVASLKQLELQERHVENDTRSAWIGRAVERLVTMLEDSDESVRVGIRNFLADTCDLLGPFREILGARLAAAICSLHAPTRIDAVQTVVPLASLLARSDIAAENVCAALRDLLKGWETQNYASRKTVALATVAFVRASSVKDADSGSRSKGPRVFYDLISVGGAAKGTSIHGATLRLLNEGLAVWPECCREVASPTELATSAALAEKFIAFLNAINDAVAGLDAEERVDLRKGLQQATSALADYFPLPQDSMSEALPSQVQNVEDVLAQLHCQVDDGDASTGRRLAEYIRSKRGQGILAVSQVCLRLQGHGSALEHEMRNLQVWLDIWKEASPIDKASDTCLQQAESAALLLRESSSGSEEPESRVGSPADAMYRSLLSSVPKLVWELVKQSAPATTIERAASTLRRLTVQNRGDPLGTSNLTSGMLRLLSSKKSGTVGAGPIKFMSPNARSDVLAALYFTQQQKRPSKGKILAAVRVCCEHKQSTKSGLTEDLLSFLGLLSYTPSDTPELLYTLLVASRSLESEMGDTPFRTRILQLMRAVVNGIGIGAGDVSSVLQAALARTSNTGFHAGRAILVEALGAS